MSLLSEKKVTVLQAQILNAGNAVVMSPPQVPQSLNVATAVYDHSILGGAIGSYTLPLSKTIPMGSAVGNFFYNATVEPTSSGSPNFSLGLNTTDDLVDGESIVGLSPSTGTMNLVAAAPIESLRFTLSGSQPVTAGRVEFRLVYV